MKVKNIDLFQLEFVYRKIGFTTHTWTCLNL